MSSFRLNDLPDELLIHVLRQVPIERRVSIRTVSRKWYSVILDIGFHVNPLFVDDSYQAPHYSKGLHLKLNPAIEWNLCRRSTLEHEYELTQGWIHRPRYKELLPRRAEFITSPPISAAHVDISLYMLSAQQRRIWMRSLTMVVRTAMPSWYRSEGIRIGDLLDIYEKMRASSKVDGTRTRTGVFSYILTHLVNFCDKIRPPVKGINPATYGGVNAMFVTCEDDLWESNVTQTASGKNGIEVRMSGPR